MIGVLLAVQVGFWDEPPVVGLDSPAVAALAQEAARQDAAGADFPSVLEALCARPASMLERFKAVIRWTRDGGKPLLQGRADWPLHLAYGGYVAALYGSEAAEAAAYGKEVRDTRLRGFDLDDYAVTLLGARLASGCRPLHRLPAFNLGALPPGRSPSVYQLWAARRLASSALP